MILIAIAAQVAAGGLAVPARPAYAERNVAAGAIVLTKDMPVELMAPTEVSTADATPGMIFKLRVNKPIQVDGATVVPVGTPAFGQVVSASTPAGSVSPDA